MPFKVAEYRICIKSDKETKVNALTRESKMSDKQGIGHWIYTRVY